MIDWFDSPDPAIADFGYVARDPSFDFRFPPGNPRLYDFLIDIQPEYEASEIVSITLESQEPSDEFGSVTFFGVSSTEAGDGGGGGEEEYEVADFPLSELELDEATVAALEAAGYTTFFDIIDLDYEDFVSIEGVEEDAARRLVEVIDELTVEEVVEEEEGPSEEDAAADPGSTDPQVTADDDDKKPPDSKDDDDKKPPEGDDEGDDKKPPDAEEGDDKRPDDDKAPREDTSPEDEMDPTDRAEAEAAAYRQKQEELASVREDKLAEAEEEARELKEERLEDARTEIEREREEILETAEGVKRIARGLRPPELADVGLSSAIRAHARSLRESAGLAVELDLDEVAHLLSEEAQLALYRIVQESLSNVVRHSGADSARVVVRAEEDRVRAAVQDRGRGFARDQMRDDGAGLGLVGMQERAVMLGGRVEVDTIPGEGTNVKIELPASAVETQNV